ncbi:hypothetical protein [Desulfobacula toluolica]|uniref:Uncharacterized protein n=1 Tax=Desulfobacula toluolica (strain DSM 7467 / Tol2) TaxID=651182 RepID=K0NMF8_DESTT|nr:hypothetical protein [Desulfobacula toluolica]CCK81218.1 uncharacterized protein TOL2_C30590 [Desulfobacula toluolica Tol2]
MFSKFGYNSMVCHDCREIFTPQLSQIYSILANKSGLAEVGRFQIVHNGHNIALINDNDPDVDWDLIKTYEKVRSFELKGNIRTILRNLYPQDE